MLSVIVFLPLLAAVGLVAARRLGEVAARRLFLAVTVVEVLLVAWLWSRYEDPGVNRLAFEQQVSWIPSVGTSLHLGLDGLSLPLVAMTVVLFAAVALYALREQDRPRQQAALFLFLECVSLGLFASADLIVFFVFFDLSIVAMYFSIAVWGHGEAARSAMKFFLYTFLGSLALLLGFIGLYVAADPHTFDMVALAREAPLHDHPVVAGLVLGSIVLGLAIKTPTFPFHTWLPSAHTDAPTIGSVVLAGVLLKMGTYGFIRVAMVMLPRAWQDWAPAIVVIGVVSVLYGALVALAQTDLKRMIAYTSINHMGYVVLAVGVAGMVAPDSETAQSVAITGAVVQMISHALITSALFMLVGSLHERGGSYAVADYGGAASTAPRLTGLFAVAAFASLGLPAFSGFIAEFQIFTGAVGLAAWTAVALLGILITAALFLRALQQVFTGETRGRSIGLSDLRPVEVSSIGGLLALSLAIGLAPRPLLDVVEPVAGHVVELVSR